jgi:hypothetical protein
MFQPFKEAFCTQFDCSPQSYERAMFFKCLPWHAKPIALLLYPLKSKMVRGGLHLIQHVGQATSLREIRNSVDSYYTWTRLDLGFWANTLRIRVSGKKVLKLAKGLYPEQTFDTEISDTSWSIKSRAR